MADIRDAFQKVKGDVSSLKDDINFLRTNLTETREKLIDICDVLVKLNEKTDRLGEQDKIITSYLEKLNSSLSKYNQNNNEKIEKQVFKHNIDDSLDKQTHFPTEKEVLKTNNQNIQTHQSYISPRNSQFLCISTGNRGVQTDRQTYKQTDIRQENSSYNMKRMNEEKDFNSQKKEDSFNRATDLMDSLDSLKKEIRLKFKRLTDQEIIVFSTIYQLEEEIGYSDYKSISNKLNLSESSIRDYVRRLLNKGVPLIKEKINNKEIHLLVSPNLKKVASLNTILELRDL